MHPRPRTCNALDAYVRFAVGPGARFPRRSARHPPTGFRHRLLLLRCSVATLPAAAPAGSESARKKLGTERPWRCASAAPGTAGRHATGSAAVRSSVRRCADCGGHWRPPAALASAPAWRSFARTRGRRFNCSMGAASFSIMSASCVSLLYGMWVTTRFV